MHELLDPRSFGGRQDHRNPERGTSRIDREVKWVACECDGDGVCEVAGGLVVREDEDGRYTFLGSPLATLCGFCERAWGNLPLECDQHLPQRWNLPEAHDGHFKHPIGLGLGLV